MQYSQTIPELWKTGLEDSLNRLLIFRDDGAKKVNLNLKILEWDTPSFGAGFTTETTARYELVDRNDGTVYCSSEITSEGMVPFDYAFAGAVRAMESRNRAAQNNISLFPQQLQTVDLSQPMFPGGTAHGVAIYVPEATSHDRYKWESLCVLISFASPWSTTADRLPDSTVIRLGEHLAGQV